MLRVKQYSWVCDWLQKNSYLKTLDTLIEEGADILSDIKSENKDNIPLKGDKNYSNSELDSIDDLHKNNVLSVRFHPDKDSNLILTTSTDKTLKLYNYKTSNVISEYTGPIIVSVDWNPKITNRAVVGTMDSYSLVLDFDLENKADPVVVFQTKAHNRHVVRSKWHPNGRIFATASNDHKVFIFSHSGENNYEIKEELSFNSAVEAIEFTPDGKSLIIAARGDGNLKYLDIETMNVTDYSLDPVWKMERTEHSVLDINASYDGKYILACTDNNKAVAFVANSSVQARVFYGMKNDKWSQPRSAWSLSQNYIYTTSQDNLVYIFDMSNEKVVHHLKGHSKMIRDIHHHPSEEIVATCSYDKKIKLWNKT